MKLQPFQTIPLLLHLSALITAIPLISQENAKPPGPALRVSDRYGLIFPAGLPNGIYTAPLITLPPNGRLPDPSSLSITPTLISPLHSITSLSSLPPLEPTTPGITPASNWWDFNPVTPACKSSSRRVTSWSYTYLFLERHILDSPYLIENVPPQTVSAVVSDHDVYYICNYDQRTAIWANMYWLLDVMTRFVDPKCGKLRVGWAKVESAHLQAYGREVRGYDVCWPGYNGEPWDG